jgi:hypothetical protein
MKILILAFQLHEDWHVGMMTSSCSSSSSRPFQFQLAPVTQSPAQVAVASEEMLSSHYNPNYNKLKKLLTLDVNHLQQSGYNIQ